MTFRRLLLLAVLVLPVALWARWHGSPEAAAPFFHPRPDALEYAASAQAIAQSGRFYLQVGPYQVRPRYPPGWPLVLAGALRTGVDGTDLWRVTGIFGALLAWLVAAVVACVVAAYAAGGAGPLLAGLLAGWLWAFAPIAAGADRTLLSDEPAALAGVACLLLTGFGLLLTAKPRTAIVCAALGGLSLGLSAAMRPIAACLLAPPLGVLLLASLRRTGIRLQLPRLAACILGAAIFPTAVMILLHHSGLRPTEWSGYAFWVPERYGRLSDTFSLSYALKPDEDFNLGTEGEPLSHLGIAARVLLGLPGLRARHSLGLVWPILGWIAAVPLLRTTRAARRREGAVADLAPWIAAALLLWVAGHVVVFSLYFYPTSRFYLGPLALCTALFASACGLGWSQPGLRTRVPAILAALLALLLTVRGWTDLQKEPLPEQQDERTRSRFARWKDRGDDERAGRIVPFDPLFAQALGLLPPDVAESVHVWGTLPPTVHVRRLRSLGVLPPEPPPMR
ncbi:MAG TPA: hypothetical protein VH988_11540 [Thermoanaerobaculia bacterium]|jgi:hypothetical protein|nr:hypothetical protein [Thermoanaerobaculia bacterium]